MYISIFHWIQLNFSCFFFFLGKKTNKFRSRQVFCPFRQVNLRGGMNEKSNWKCLVQAFYCFLSLPSAYFFSPKVSCFTCEQPSIRMCLRNCDVCKRCVFVVPRIKRIDLFVFACMSMCVLGKNDRCVVVIYHFPDEFIDVIQQPFLHFLHLFFFFFFHLNKPMKCVHVCLNGACFIERLRPVYHISEHQKTFNGTWRISSST